jgi:hypothetical protein
MPNRSWPDGAVEERGDAMKVIAINGSPNAQGNTCGALAGLGERLGARGIEFEIAHIGDKVVRGCSSCGTCAKRRDGKCVFADDPVNEALAAMRELALPPLPPPEAVKKVFTNFVH